MPASGRPTIYDVAHRAGVSKSLVSLVLQGAEGVSDARREAVLASIHELGYRPSRAATLLASRATRTVEVVIDDYRNLWFVDLVRGLQQAMAGDGYAITVTERRPSPDRVAVDFLGAQADAVVLAMEPDEALLRVRGVPVVVAGWRDRLPEAADLVSNDDQQGGRLAAAHLAALGHRRVGHLTGSGGAATRRRQGFHDGAAPLGLAVTVIDGGDTTEEDGYFAAVALLDEAGRDRPTAVFTANDMMAVGAWSALTERGLRVPEDVSLLGYDNSAFTGWRLLGLSTVDGRSDEVGAQTAELLRRRLSGETFDPERRLVPPQVLVRDTTAAPARR